MSPPSEGPHAGPSDSSSLRGKLDFMHTIERLKTQTRTGWGNVGVPGRIESIADHMYRMSILALLSEEDQQLDIGKCVQMAVVHDLAEAIVGDITPHDGISKEQKQKLEEDAMHTMTHVNLDPNGSASKRIQALWNEYEQRETREAKFVKDLDLLEMALQGYEYETERRSEAIQPFFDSSVPKIRHPEVRKWGQQLMLDREEHRRQRELDVHADELNSKESILEDNGPPEVIAPPNGLVKLPSTVVPVINADDEIYDLYTRLSRGEGTSTSRQTSSNSNSNSSNHAGLGFLDPKKSLIEIEIEIPRQQSPLSPKTRARAKRRPSDTAGIPEGQSKAARTSKPSTFGTETLLVVIQQDLNGLYRRHGDTGSVVWRASVLLATYIFHDFPRKPESLFDHDLLRESSVLELGAGTGVLSSILAPLVKSWTATDLEDLLPLIQRNHHRNCTRLYHAQVSTQELDWMWTTKDFTRLAGDVSKRKYDIVFAVDCLFNEALVEPFVNTLNRISANYYIIASELRSADVLRLFIEKWLASGNWSVYRVDDVDASVSNDNGDGAVNPVTGILGRKHVVWVAWPSRLD